MKLKYLGTAAAEGVPALFCFCPVCRRAAELGGRNIRTRSQALIDDKILIDLPPDTYMHVLNYGLDLKEITTLIVTHSHPDHLYATELEMRNPGFAHAPEGIGEKPLNIFASKIAGVPIRRIIEEEEIDENTVKLNCVEAFKPFEAEGYVITPYKASHAKIAGPFIYSISDGKKTLLYAHDTGYFLEETWEALKKINPYFDFVSLDCTGMLLNYTGNHMGIDACNDVREKLIEIGCADENTKWCYQHFSHNGLLTYDEMVPIAQERGFLVAYDGMEVEI